ncbi:tetratricopeptide repeat protein [bacterium]|nr:tetratricopeptide repeat protein [bacterium]
MNTDSVKSGREYNSGPYRKTVVIGGRRFTVRRLTPAVFGILLLLTLVVSYIIAWNMVRGPVKLTYRANELLIEGRIEESLKTFEKALDGNPRIKMAWSGKGLCLLYLGRYEEAITSYEKVLVLDPAYSLAWQGKGLSYENLGRYEEAIRCYDRVLDYAPDNSSTLSLKNKLLKKRGITK